MTAAAGIATTSSSPMSCRRGCWTSSPTTFLSCTGGRVRGTSRTTSRPRRSATRWPRRISSERRTWSSWRFLPCAGAGRRLRCLAGSSDCPTRWSGSGPYSASGLPGRCWLAASTRASRPDCGTPSGGWTGRQVSVWDPKPQRRRWSSSTTRNFAASRRALELAPADEHLGRASAAALMGLAFWASGDLEAGHSGYAECMAGLRRAGHIADTFGCAIALADIRRTQGRLGEAMRTYEQALQRASQPGEPVLRGTADMYVGMSEIHRERDDLPAATQQLLRSQDLGEHTGLPQNRYRWRVAMARIREAEGDLGGALDLLNEAERFYVGDFFPNVRPVPALRARVRIAQGELG